MIRPLRLIVMLACLQLGCGGQQAAAPTAAPSPVPEPVPAPTPTTAAVTGHLRDGGTEGPAADAFVAWNAPGGLFRSTRSDGAGYFSFENVPLGPLRITAATNWARGEREVTLTGDTVVDMVLAPLKFTLSGRVTDAASGTPLAGAAISVIESPFAREPRNAGRSTMSGSDGTYRLPDIWIGGFTLDVRRTGYDPIFRTAGVNGDTQHDFQMRAARQTLAGTWTGELTASGFAGGVPISIGIVTLRHTGATIAADVSGISFSGTLADASAIGATTHVAGTLTVTRVPSGPRIPPPVPCVGTGTFTGIVNWTNLSITAAQVSFAPVRGEPSSTCGGTERVTLRIAR